MRCWKGVDNQFSYKGVENPYACQATGNSWPAIGLRNFQGEDSPKEGYKISWVEEGAA